MVITLANILILTSVSFMIWKKEPHLIRAYYWPALIIKMSAGVGLGFLYRYYYTIGDTFLYFDDAARIAGLMENGLVDYLSFLWSGQDHPLMDTIVLSAPRALFFSKIASIPVLLSGFNYWIACCYFSLISFLSAWSLVKEITAYKEELTGPAVFAFLFFPSAVFWTSGLIKESLAMACLYFIVTVFLRLWRKTKWSPAQWALLPIAVWILWGLKYYYVAVLFPVIVTELVMKRLMMPRLQTHRVAVDILIWLTVFTVPLCFASIIHPNFYPERFLNVIVFNHDTFVSISDPGDAIHYEGGLFPTVGSVLRHAPKAVVSGLFRPFPWEAGSILQVMASIENAALLILTVGFVITLFRRRRADPLVFQTLLFCLLLIAFLALSTPNFGTLSRYRVGLLPFYVLVVTGRNLFPSRPSTKSG